MIIKPNNWYRITAITILITLSIIFYFGKIFPFVRATLGDYLVVIFLYTSTLSIKPELSPKITGLIILLIAYSIELLQISIIPKLLNTNSRIIEATLGSTFDFYDIIAYTVGIFSIVSLDIFIRKTYK